MEELDMPEPTVVRPDPDPTTRSVELVERSILALEKQLDIRMAALEKAQLDFKESITRVPTEVQKAVQALRELTLETFKTQDAKLNSVDVMVEQAAQHRDHLSNTVTLKVEGTHRLIEETFKIHDERFKSIDKQFVERDVRTEQTSRDSKVAVDAALSAAKEAVGEQNKSSSLAISKSESSTNKQLDQLGLLLNSVAKASDEKIADLKDRLTLIEGRADGSRGQVVESRSSQASTISLVMVGVAVLGILFTGVNFLIARQTPPVVVERSNTFS